MRRRVCAAVLSAGLILVANPAHAHHSFAMFDMTTRVTLTGTVGSELAKERAGQIALGTPGVVDLVNQLAIRF